MRAQVTALTALALIGCSESSNDDIILHPVDASVGGPLTAEFNVTDKFGQATDRFVVGDDINFEIIVANPTDEAVTYYTTGPGFDVVVEQHAEEVWSLFHGLAFPQVIDENVLDAGRSLSLKGRWTGLDNAGSPVPDGAYRVVPIVAFGLPDGSAAATAPPPADVTVR